MRAHVFDVNTLSINLIIIADEMAEFNFCGLLEMCFALLRHWAAYFL